MPSTVFQLLLSLGLLTPTAAFASGRQLEGRRLGTSKGFFAPPHGHNDCEDASRRSLFTAATLLAAIGFTSPAHAVLNQEEAARIKIFESTAPSVVFIDTFTARRDTYSADIMEVPLGAGSGFVWDKEGHIVTNFHVVRNAQAAQVAILSSVSCDAAGAKSVIPTSACSSSAAQGTQPFTSMRPETSSTKNTRFVYPARVVGVDPSKDIAVLKVDAPSQLLKPIKIGTSRDIKVGQQAYAIGNPFGLDHTLTAGIISGTGRVVTSPIGRPISNVLQTDAAINPGNSGGALLDSSGKLIGMNTAIYSTTGASAGIGFAIPIDTIKYIVDKLIRDGKVVRPMLGITLLGSTQARALGIGNGVLVLDVPPGSPAAEAGLKGTKRSEDGLVELGDVITKIGDTVVNREADLFQALEDYNVGDVAEVTVNRVVAIDDELRVKVVRLAITLSSSADVEKEVFAFQ